MNIEDYFLNLGWICIKEIEKEHLLDILNLNVDKLVTWEDGYELVINSFDEKVFLNFQIHNWEFLVGKYFFLDNDALKNTMNDLSQKSAEVKAFAIDVWSNYYCYSKSIHGENIRFWMENDSEIINEGELTKEESIISENDKANKLLELTNQTTVQFELIEVFLQKNKVQILN